MFNWFRQPEKTGLQVAHEDALFELKSYTPDSDEYKKIMKHVKTLSKLIAEEKPETLSPNTVLVVLGNVGIAGFFTIFEKSNIVTTKVIPFLMKSSIINR